MGFQINKLLLPMKGHYFLWNAGTAPVVPFLSVYAKELGFSSFIVGLVYTILPITGMLSKPIMGAIADKFKCQKIIFLIMEIVTVLAFIAILYVPSIEPASKANFKCDYSESFLDTCVGNATDYDIKFIMRKLKNLPNETATCDVTCPLNDSMWSTVDRFWDTPHNSSHTAKTFNFKAHIPLYLTDNLNMNCAYFKVANVTMADGRTVHPICPAKENKLSAVCDIRCDSRFVSDLLPRSTIPDGDVLKLPQFWQFLVLMIIAWVGQAVVVSTTDAVCFELLGDKPNKYGQQRFYGSLGWGIFSIVAGVIIDGSNSPGTSKYSAAFYLCAAIIFFDVLVSLRIKCEQKYTSQSILRDVSRLLVNVQVIIFLVWIVFIGMCTGLIWNFLFWLIEDLAPNDEWIKTLEGLMMAIQCLGGELPFFFLSGWILKRLGHIHSMTLILVAMGIRYILYSLIANPWYLLPVEFLNGITFGLFYACMASYASIIAPPGTETTIQGLVGAIFEVGVSLGSFLGGLSFQEFKGPLTFRIFGIASLVMCLLHAFVQYVYNNRKRDLARYSPADDAFDAFLDDEQELKLVD